MTHERTVLYKIEINPIYEFRLLLCPGDISPEALRGGRVSLDRLLLVLQREEVVSLRTGWSLMVTPSLAA